MLKVLQDVRTQMYKSIRSSKLGNGRRKDCGKAELVSSINQSVEFLDVGSAKPIAPSDTTSL